MPKIVDYAQRRSEIVEALLELIADQGMVAATSRSLANHLGVSNGALWRYFKDKDDLLAATYARVIEKSDRRVEDAIQGRTGLAAVLAMMDTFFPTTPETKDEAKVVLAFWGVAAMNPQHSGVGNPETDKWVGEFVTLLEQAILSKELRPDTPAAALASVLMSVAMNAQVEYVFREDDGSAQALHIRRMLNSYRP